MHSREDNINDPSYYYQIAVVDGKELADRLIKKNMNCVSLVGYSFGSLVIYECLMELKKREATGIIEDVILLGLPAIVNLDQWKSIRQIVPGRLINGYIQNDSFLNYISSNYLSFNQMCGKMKIELDYIESYDLSSIVMDHRDYPREMKRIFEAINIKNC